VITFKTFLSENFKNLFTPEEKKKYAEEAYAQLVQSYKKVGGLAGSGFSSVEDFIQNIPFWKLKIGKDGRIVSGSYYKDKNGRKRVAISSDGSREGLQNVAEVMIADLAKGRAYGEVSSASLRFLIKRIGIENVKKYAIDPVDVKKLVDSDIEYPVPDDDEEVKLQPSLKKFFYQRAIGGEMHTKIAMGTLGKKIT